MSQNQKLINIFREFLKGDVGASSYDIKEYGLKSNYPLSVILGVKAGGSEGGGCWDGQTTSSFSQSRSEMESDLAREITYKFSNLFAELGIDRARLDEKSKLTAENSYYSEIGEKTDSSDYYGNYTTYNGYAVDTVDFLKDVLSEHQLEVFRGVASQYKKQHDLDFNITQAQEKEQELVNRLDRFQKSKADECNNLESRLLQAQKDIKEYTERLTNFNKTKEIEKKKLESDLNAVRDERKKLQGSDFAPCSPEQENKRKNRW